MFGQIGEPVLFLHWEKPVSHLPWERELEQCSTCGSSPSAVAKPHLGGG